MKKIIVICPYPPRHAPSQRFRFEQYLPLLQEKFDVKYFSFLSVPGWKRIYQEGRHLRKLLGVAGGLFLRWYQVFLIIPFADLIFIHREAAPLGPPVFEWFIAKILRKKIIYDFDDAIWIPNTSQQNRIAALFKCHWKVNYICRWSYKISCGNEFLADFARKHNQNVVVNPTTIDTEHLHNPGLYLKPVNAIPVIGWTGTHSTLIYLDSLIPVLKDLENKHEFEFRVISNQPPESIPLKNYRFIQWNQDTEIEDLIQFDIGVMPLTPDPWSAGKCGFKALQYMALEIPAVVDAVGVNPIIVENGQQGFICHNAHEWKKNLEMLLKDRDLRLKMGQSGRARVKAHYSISSNSENFLSLFE